MMSSLTWVQPVLTYVILKGANIGQSNPIQGFMRPLMVMSTDYSVVASLRSFYLNRCDTLPKQLYGETTDGVFIAVSVVCANERAGF
jgi:hypothetical protein